MRFLIALVLLFMAVPFSAEAVVEPRPDSTLQILKSYVLQTTKVQKNGAAFFTLENTSDTPRKITGAISPVAQRVELHTHEMDGDVMMMRQVDAYDVPADGVLTLEPMGHHIMLMGLHAPLEAGQTVPLILTFEEGEAIGIEIPVLRPEDAP